MAEVRNAMHLDGKRVLITGAGSGIARSAAVQMTIDGAEVWGLDWSAPGLEGTGALVSAAGGRWNALTLDVSDPARVREAVATVRGMIGATDGAKASPGTIRGDHGLSVQNNLIHGSDSVDNAHLELALWFCPNELVSWAPVDQSWIG